MGWRDDAIVWAHGPIKPQLVCPHCGVRGSVHARSKDAKTGISGGKATAALLTCGLSLLAVGLSRHQQITEAWCGNCGSTWRF